MSSTQQNRTATMSNQTSTERMAKRPQIVVEPDRLRGGSQGVSKLIFDNKIVVEYRMLSARLHRGDLGGVTRIALGHAYLIAGKECAFEATSLADLLQCVQADEAGKTEETSAFKKPLFARPTHVYLELAWSKGGGSIYEEELPFEGQIAWAGKLDALYLERRNGDTRIGAHVPKHGVDYVVFPTSVFGTQDLKLLVAEYTDALQGIAQRQSVKTARLQQHATKVDAATANLQKVLDAQERQQKAQEAEAERLQKQNLRNLKGTNIGSVIGAMRSPTPVAVSRFAM